MFGPASLKELKQQAEQIGSMCGQAYVGVLSWADFADVVNNEGFRTRLQSAFAAASADVGEAKALKAAVKEARKYAQAVPYVRKVPLGDVETRAEVAIKEMLGRA